MKNKTGLAGRILAFATILLGLTAQAAQAKEKDCSLKLMTDIDLIVAPDGSAILPVTLNGKRAGLGLQLEAIASLIAPDAADAWSLPRRVAPFDIKFGSQKIEQMAEYADLTVGDLKYGKGVLLVAPKPIPTPTVEGVQVIGWLSGSAFRGVDFELDLAHKKFKVFSQDHCRGQVVYWSDQYSSAPLYAGVSGQLFFPIELDGKKVFAAISNTRAVSTIGTDVTRAFYGFDKSSPGIEATRDPDGALYHYRAMQITSQGLTVTNARIQLVDQDPDSICKLDIDRRIARYRCSGGYPMSIGTDVLRQLRMFFARKEGKIYFTAADVAAKEPVIPIKAAQ